MQVHWNESSSQRSPVPLQDASVTQAIDVRGVDPEYKYCETEDCGPYVYEAGTLLIDLVDARTQQLVWRGWAEAVFDDVIDNQRSMEVMGSMARMIAHFAPRCHCVGGRTAPPAR